MSATVADQLTLCDECGSFDRRWKTEHLDAFRLPPASEPVSSCGNHLGIEAPTFGTSRGLNEERLSEASR